MSWETALGEGNREIVLVDSVLEGITDENGQIVVAVYTSRWLARARRTGSSRCPTDQRCARQDSVHPILNAEGLVGRERIGHGEATACKEDGQGESLDPLGQRGSGDVMTR